MRHTNMRRIWKQKLSELDKIIADTSISEQSRLTELYDKRELLQTAFCQCK